MFSKTRPTWLGVILVLATIAGACGDDADSTDGAPESDATATTQPPEPEDADAGDGGEEADPVGDSTDDDDAPESSTRTVTHVLGTTEIPREPERIYVNDPNALDVLVALGADVAGATRWRPEFPVPEYIASVSEVDIELSADREPNFEMVAAFAPDLIVTANSTDNTAYDLFSQIAPTVAYGESFDTADRSGWKVALEEIAAIIGREDAVAGILADYDADVARLAAALDQAGLADSTFAVMQPRDNINFRLRIPLGMVLGDTLWDDVGLAYQEFDDGLLADHGFFADLSAERVDLITADMLFVLVPLGFGEVAREQLESNPLWSFMPSFQQGNICLLDAEGGDQAWFENGPLSLRRVVDDVIGCIEAFDT
ncbi:MAG: ABC transporter substrate-binding protein [Actinomycetota bacterium]